MAWLIFNSKLAEAPQWTGRSAAATGPGALVPRSPTAGLSLREAFRKGLFFVLHIEEAKIACARCLNR